jgi:hypothetical protein
MPLLTIFTAPKPFTDPHISLIQRNAIHSWLGLGDQVEVFLIGDEDGMQEASRELGVRQLAQVRRNAWGTPLISSIFTLARQNSSSPYLCYANADILFLPDILDATRLVAGQKSEFLLIGQRWDLDVRQALDFSKGWPARLGKDVRSRGRLHPPAGSDYFIFPVKSYQDLPDFAVGRAGWDNWMIYYAIQSDWAVIDCTSAVTAVHQDHDYGHLPDGKPHYKVEESDLNRSLAGGRIHMYLVTDANKRLVDGSIETVGPGLAGFIRRAELWLTPAQANPTGARWNLARRLRRIRRRIR